MPKLLSSLSFVIIAVLFFSACNKEEVISSPNARLGISTDSLRYDTLFTTTGSVTKSFKILNLNDQRLRLSSLRLAGGPQSAYKVNVNGTPGDLFNNIDIAANDSIYVFVTVTVNPSAANLPFIVADSIRIEYNGNVRFVQLEAFGQNANFIRNGVVSGNITFNSSIPYVILGGLTVAPAGILTLAAGTQIYCHADAALLIDGTLLSNGTKPAPVLFRGDRRDEPYSSFPASWPGIYFRAQSKNSLLNFTCIENAYQAVVVLSPSNNANPKLILRQCIINNAYDAGLLCRNTSVTAENCLITNSGKNIFTELGGTYSFTHCTVASYSTAFNLHQTPVAFFSDADADNVSQPLNVTCRNSIFWGDAGFVQNEITTRRAGSNFSVLLDRCLFRAANDPSNAIFQNVIRNLDPSFDSVDVSNKYFDFRITKNATAPGINTGAATGLLKDLDDKNRNVGAPDLGAYEKQ